MQIKRPNIRKVAGFSLVGFCAVSVAADRMKLGTIVSEIVGFCGAFLGAWAGRRISHYQQLSVGESANSHNGICVGFVEGKNSIESQKRCESTDMRCMTPSQIQTELNKTAVDLSALRKEVTAKEFQSRNDPRTVSEVESKLAAAEQCCRKCASVAGELVAAGAQQGRETQTRK